jgi:hypothetical protein
VVGVDAFANLAALLNASPEANSNVYVAPGTYSEAITINVNGLKFYGNNANCESRSKNRNTAESIITRRVCAEGEGDYALTRWRVLARTETHTLVEASPVTGRTHQLRVHFAHLSCPIHGDDLYGYAADDLPRQALHAITLVFPHPADRRSVCLTAPPPDDLRACIVAHFGKDILL